MKGSGAQGRARPKVACESNVPPIYDLVAGAQRRTPQPRNGDVAFGLVG